jgi:hypothetical protein
VQCFYSIYILFAVCLTLFCVVFVVQLSAAESSLSTFQARFASKIFTLFYLTRTDFNIGFNPQQMCCVGDHV